MALLLTIQRLPLSLTPQLLNRTARAFLVAKAIGEPTLLINSATQRAHFRAPPNLWGSRRPTTQTQTQAESDSNKQKKSDKTKKQQQQQQQQPKNPRLEQLEKLDQWQQSGLLSLNQSVDESVSTKPKVPQHHEKRLDYETSPQTTQKVNPQERKRYTNRYGNRDEDEEVRDDVNVDQEFRKAFDLIKTTAHPSLGEPVFIERKSAKKIGKRYNLVSIANAEESVSAVDEFMAKQEDFMRLKKLRPRDGLPPSTRQLRVAQLIREALGQILTKKMVWELPSDLISIRDIRMATDLRTATILWSTQKESDAALIIKALENKIGFIRSLIAQHIQLRYAPNLVFRRDESESRINRLNEIFDRIKSE